MDPSTVPFYPSNLQRHSQISPIFYILPYPEPSYTNNSPSMNSDNTSSNTFFHTISQFNNSDFETPDQFADFETSPSTLFLPHFQSLYTQIPDEPSSAPSSFTDATPIYSPMTSDPPDQSSLVDIELEKELENFITLQLQLQHPNPLTIHHVSQTMTSSESSNSPSTTAETRAHRVLKRKFPNTPFPSNPRPGQIFVDYPLHTNTKEFLQVCLPFFPQYTNYHSNPNNEQPTYVNEKALFPTLSWTSYYHFSNPLSLPLYNNPDKNELCQTRLYHLTTGLHEKQCTATGLNQTQTRFTAQKTNKFFPLSIRITPLHDPMKKSFQMTILTLTPN